MPARLGKTKADITAWLQLKLPTSLKRKAVTMAREEGDGDMSSLMRRMIQERWNIREERRRAQGLGA